MIYLCSRPLRHCMWYITLSHLKSRDLYITKIMCITSIIVWECTYEKLRVYIKLYTSLDGVHTFSCIPSIFTSQDYVLHPLNHAMQNMNTFLWQHIVFIRKWIYCSVGKFTVRFFMWKLFVVKYFCLLGYPMKFS